MDLRQNPSMNGKEGRLPARAPLAVPFVPFQEEGAPKYEAAKGLIRGTLFPGLDLPFMGMTNQKELAQTPMSELQALAFAVQELALYLDTHREDQEALNLYKKEANCIVRLFPDLFPLMIAVFPYIIIKPFVLRIP